MSKKDKKNKAKESQSELYSSDYKHFDNLIWQLPIWSTAIFIIVITLFSQNTLLSDQGESTTNTTKIIALIVCWIYHAAIYNALVRFRHHQSTLKNPTVSAFAKSFWRSGQTWLHFAVLVQLCALTYLLSDILAFQYHISLCLSVVIFVIGLSYAMVTIKSSNVVA